MSTKPPIAIVLAAGKGTRMQSELPKVLTHVGGRPMIRYVIDALSRAGARPIVVVVGYRADLVKAELADLPDVQFALQAEQLGTGHAVMMCRKQLAAHQGAVIVVTGDSPLLQTDSLLVLLRERDASQAACVLGTVRRSDPSGFGRIVRDPSGDFLAIVEEKDASPTERSICEVNPSTYVFDSQELLTALDSLRSDNSQGEYYITDCPAYFLNAGKRVLALDVMQPCESLSVNSREDLPAVEQALRTFAQ